MVYRRKVVHDDLSVRNTPLFTNCVMRNRLRAQWNQTRQRIRVNPIRCEPALVQTHHRAQISTRAVPREKHLLRVAPVLLDVLNRPRDCGGCIFYKCWRFYIGAEPITCRHNGNSLVLKAIRDTAIPAR